MLAKYKKMQTNNQFTIISKIIKERRTRKAQLMSGKKIEDANIEKILELADCAPTHGRTEPWRFHVFADKGFADFCNNHAQLYWEGTDEAIRNTTKRDLFGSLHQFASHLIVVTMERTQGVKIPDFEEYAACCAAVQNILLGAEALGLAAIWNSGGMSYSDKMKEYLGIKEEDQVVALVYLGYLDTTLDKEAKRRISLKDKTQWIKA